MTTLLTTENLLNAHCFSNQDDAERVAAKLDGTVIPYTSRGWAVEFTAIDADGDEETKWVSYVSADI